MALPRIIILKALRAHFRAAVRALPPERRFKVRHWRFRSPSSKEMPCVSLRFAGDDAPGITRASDADGPSIAEDVFELGIDLVADSPIPAEVDEEGDDSAEDEGDDPTGLETCSQMLEDLLDSLFTPGEQPETLGGRVWDIRYDGSADDDDVSTPDNVRLAERITLMYRVRAEAPTHLLIGE